MKLPYKIPTIVRCKNGDWFVKYWYEYPNRPGEYKEFRVRDGVNYEHDPVRKEKEIQRLQKDISNALERFGYSPFDQQTSIIKQNYEEDERQIKEDAMPDKWTMELALVKFVDYCKWKELSENTVRTYRTFISNFKDWLTDTGKLNVLACEYLETDYVEFADSYSDAEDWTPRTYNNHISFLVTLFNRVRILEKKTDRSIQYHINLEDLDYKTDKAEKNRAYSGIVAERVKKELEAPGYEKLNQLVKLIYLSCMRPKEIRLLQIQHIDLANRQIKVAGPTGKTGDRFVPISDELLKLLNEFKFEKLPLNYFLFGKGGHPGDTTHGRTYFSDQYKLIKVKLGLDKNYTMYSWKHTRIIALIRAGFKDEEIMKLTGHKDYKSFEAYKRDLVADDTLMTGKTIDW